MERLIQKQEEEKGAEKRGLTNDASILIEFDEH